jgi:RimJ/RimL family protein N-acetyltransferase
MEFSIQPILEDALIILLPLQEDDFGALYAVAADPRIWEQHPNRDRWRKEVFTIFFEGAMRSGGAFKILDKATGEIAGCTRIYDYDASESRIFIGYTFFGTKFWGKGYNPASKTLLLDYLFQFVEKVGFQIGAGNIRSQIAISRLGAEKVDEQEVAYYGEPPKLNYVYAIGRQDWWNRSRYPG